MSPSATMFTFVLREGGRGEGGGGEGEEGCKGCHKKADR